MRKFTLFLLIFALLLCYTGCSKDEEKENDAVVDTYLEIAQKYLDNGQPDLAISILEDALEECGENEDLAELLEEALLQKASATDQDSTAATEATAPATEAPTETTAPPTEATAAHTAADIDSFLGIWSTQGLSVTIERYNSSSLLIAVNQVNSTATRVVFFECIVPQSSFRDNAVSFTFQDDGWGNAGSIHLQRHDSSMTCIVSNVHYVGSGSCAMWGLHEGEYLLT